MRRFFKSAAFPILLVVILAFIAQKVISSGGGSEAPGYQELVRPETGLIAQERIAEVDVNTKDNTLDVKKKDGESFSTGYPPNSEQSLLNELEKANVETDVHGSGSSGLLSLLTLVLPFPKPDTCAVTVSATQAKITTPAASLSISLQFAPQQGADPTPTPTPTSGGGTHTLYRGLGGKCIDALHNGSANGTKVTIYGCNRNNPAQYFTYTNGYLKHNGKCLNDQRTGGNGSKVILYTCNNGANEKWTHKTNGEFVMKAKGGQYCLDDPASSKKDGTQLIVWKCNNATNQHWFASTVS